jgi:hypothetical protein
LLLKTAKVDIVERNLSRERYKNVPAVLYGGQNIRICRLDITPNPAEYIQFPRRI